MSQSGLDQPHRNSTEAEGRAAGHTPTPWTASNLDGIFSQQRQDGGQNPIGFVYLPAFAERSPVGRQAMADRHFINLAVNSYDAMRAALEGLLAFAEDAETKALVGDEACLWPVEAARVALALARGIPVLKSADEMASTPRGLA